MTTTTIWVDDHFIAGNVALDFANTVYRRTPALGADLLNTRDALTGWLRHAGLLAQRDLDSRHRDGDAALQQARTLRSLLWELFDAQADGRDLPPEAVARLLGLAQDGLAQDGLAQDGLGQEVTVTADGTVAPRGAKGALTSLALRAVVLVLSPPPRPVRTCDRCGWFFMDNSRGRRRRWCSMKTCGNQAKAERFRGAHP